jgi:hypothetical protein
MERTLTDADITALKEALRPAACNCRFPSVEQKDFEEVWPVLSSFAHSVKTGQKIGVSIFVKVLMIAGVALALFGFKVMGKGLVETVSPYIKVMAK